MARLFRKEFHQYSNTWTFKKAVQETTIEDLFYWKYKDEKGNVIFQFNSDIERLPRMKLSVRIVYNAADEVILDYTCQECPGTKDCPHYFTVLKYAYEHLSTDIIDGSERTTYQKNVLTFNEYWEKLILESEIEVSDIFDPRSDKIRIYFNKYAPFNIRLVSTLIVGKEPLHEASEELLKAKKQLTYLPDDEILLHKLIQSYKCSYSNKGMFYTIYKEDFIHILPALRLLQHKVFIKETGDKIHFSEEPLSVNFRIRMVDGDDYLLMHTYKEKINTFFLGNTTYIFLRNIVYSKSFPFQPEILKEILMGGLHLKRHDLIYYYTVVSKQLALMQSYLDFDEEIVIPEVYDTRPTVNFHLNKQDEKIVMDGFLEYAPDLRIPIALLRMQANLIKYQIEDRDCWFYIPPQTISEVMSFLNSLPLHQIHKLNEDMALEFEGELQIDILKKTIFDLSEENWNIEVAPELKKEFVYKVQLNVEINAKRKEDIDWFEYEIEYTYRDMKFSHGELKKFFKTKQKFMKLQDGRLLYFVDKKSFDNVEKLLERSKDQKDEIYGLASYNLPYLYQLTENNPAIKVFGDKFLTNMYTDIMTRGRDHKENLPPSLSPIMRNYQKSGFYWLKMLERFQLGGILADEMGLGKTIQALSLLASESADSLSMVVCPKTLLYNWAAEISKFIPSLPYIIMEGNKNQRALLLKNMKNGVIIVSYSIIVNDLIELQKKNFRYVILDEAQHIKNVVSHRTKAIKKLRTQRRLALTGTPMENNLDELWSIFDFLMPGLLPTRKRFKNMYASKEDAANLTGLIAPFILRRRKKEVLVELPDKQEQVIPAKMTVIQEKVYLQVLDEIKKSLMPVLADDGTVLQNRSTYVHILAGLTKLRQICNHPALIDKSFKTEPELSGKMEMLFELVREALDSGRKILIFSQFVEMLKIIRNQLNKMEVPIEYMDGSTKNRQERIDHFNDNHNIRVFLISLKTGGFGINLTSADTVIIVDPWWNPMVENQAIDRTHRIGQTKKVLVYKLITKGTVEEKILSLQKNKKELFDYIIEQGESVFQALTLDDLQKLFTY
ncbi:MAG: DEAD/DEAH box helicase [Candidatus Zophobacter franzmannii]|nr:DEAD/DEAH box helicase [Candidatus Zophobacter franzmannii]